MKIISNNQNKKIVIIQGSPREINNCPKQNGKTFDIASKLIDNSPKDIDLDFLDLRIIEGRSIIQPCKGCISTAGGYQCHFPCDCYSKNNKKTPDLMHNEDVYQRLLSSDGFMVISPVHWYSVSTSVKALFDRLVCINKTLTVEDSKKLNLNKNTEKTIPLEISRKYDNLLKNHFEGKFAAFVIHGDDGAADYKEMSGDPNAPPMPKSLGDGSKMPPEGKINNPRNAILPIVWQCRYSGINVPDDLVVGIQMNRGLKYSEANKTEKTKEMLMNVVIDTLNKLNNYISDKIKS